MRLKFRFQSEQCFLKTRFLIKMDTEQRIILVSNRLPFQLTSKKGMVSFLPSAGGLVSSLKSFIQRSRTNDSAAVNNAPIVWIGSSDIAENKFKEHFSEGYCLHDEFTLFPVFIPAAVKDKHYNGFCNDTIWPLFHYFPSFAKFKDEYYEHYQKANQYFAEKIARIYQPGDLIWIHDYHLMLLPALLRNRIPDATIGFFLHIPFPSFELYRLLPNKWRRDILNGLLGADLVGFHTNDYAQHFLKSVKQLLGYDHTLRVIMTPERSILTDAFPISIDFRKFYQATSDENVFTERNAIRKKLNGLKIVISVDRLDYTKAIVSRLKSFELFLEKNPDYVGKVTYILIVVPSRDIITKYRENKKDIDEMISTINGRFGSIEWTPVIYQYRSLDFEQLTGLYLAADVALITPIRDGMNLVAKEFIATRSDKRGVLILSETAGAASELGEAILVNPTDRNEVADALLEALNMPAEEQVRRNEMMQKRLRNYDITKWSEDFVSSVLLSKERQELFKVKEVNQQTEKRILEAYFKAKKRLIFLDYDGTLIPFARLPQLATPPEGLLKLLQNIAEERKNTVVLISGRSSEVLENWFGNIPVHLVAEHGAFIKMAGGKWQQTLTANPGWKVEVMNVFNRFTERCAGTFIEEKALSLAWHYRNAENDLGFLRSRELIDSLDELSAHLDFQVIEGNKVVEARTRGIDKGTAALTWINGGTHDFCLAIGDDRTDEDMFKVIPPDEYAIRVGLVPSAARFNMKSQKEVLAFLEKLHALNTKTDIERFVKINT